MSNNQNSDNSGTNVSSNDTQAIPTKAIWISFYHMVLLLIASLASIVVMHPHCCTPPTCILELKNPILCIAFGLIGGTLNASRQVIKAVKSGKYIENRILWQLLTPLHSGIFAVVAIVFIKSGMRLAVDSSGAAGPNYMYFISVTSFLVGFSTEIFIKKLILATEALFGEKSNILNEDDEQNDNMGKNKNQ